MFKSITTILIAVVCSVSFVFSNGLNLNSIGVKGGSMGGAFIGLADDYTAAYWNPAGISQLKKAQIGAYFTGVMPTATYKLEQAGIDAISEPALFPVPGIMGYVPLVSGIINAGLGVYIPSGLGVTWNGDDLKNLSGGNSYEWMSKIGVVHIAPAISFKVMPSLSVGAALNLSYGFLDLKQPQMSMNINQAPVWGQYSESSSGWGFGATVGILFEPIDNLNVGMSFRTSNNISFEGTAEHALIKAGLGGQYKDADISRDVAWPSWFGVGLAYKPIMGLTLTADLQYTNWGSMDSIKTTYKNWEPIMTSNYLVMKWEDKIQIRFGAEFQVLSTLALRAGYYLDPAPAPDETLNILFPSISYSGPTFGAAVNFPGFLIEGGVEYLMGTERNVSPSGHNMPGIHNNNIFAFFVGMVFDI